MEILMEWVYQSKKINSIQELPEKSIGFIYCLYYEDGTKYIGKKTLYSSYKLEPLKSGKQRDNSTFINKNKNGKRVQFELVQKESNWKTYEGSIKKEIKSNLIKKEILEFAFTKLELTYLEVKHQCINDVLRSEEYLNDNILGKFYKGRL